MHAHIDSFCGVQDRSLRVSGRAELGRAELGGYFACSEVTGNAERDLRGCVWPLSCPGQPAGRQRRVAGRRETEATRSPKVASGAPMRGGLREIVLRAYTAKTADASAELSRLAAGPHRW